MGVVIRITKKSKPEETRKALDKLASRRKRNKKLADFYGKMKGAYGDGLEYQRRLRNDWS